MTSLNVPIWINAYSYHIPFGTILAQSIEDMIIAMWVGGAVEMNYHLSIRIDFLYRLVARLRQTGILFHIFFCMPHWPKESLGGFVAHLHPSYVDVMFF